MVVTQRETPFTERWRELGCEVHVIRASEPKAIAGVALLAYRARRGPEIARSNWEVKELVERSGARVVHCNDPSAFWYGGLGARLAGAEVLVNVRDTLSPGARYGVKWRLLGHLAREIVLLSDDMKRTVDRDLRPLTPLAPFAHTTFVYSALDLDRMVVLDPERRAALRAQLGIGAGEIAIGYVGTFNSKKNQLDFISEALPRLVELAPRAQVYFLGDFHPERDPYAKRCEERVHALGLCGRVRFVGFTPRPEDWYAALDVVVLASRNEGLARAMIESLACATPVVSFDVSSAREILEARRCGVVAAQGDYVALVDAMVEVTRDPAARAAMGERGARAARELFEPGRSVGAYVALYQRLAGD